MVELQWQSVSGSALAISRGLVSLFDEAHRAVFNGLFEPGKSILLLTWTLWAAINDQYRRGWGVCFTNRKIDFVG